MGSPREIRALILNLKTVSYETFPAFIEPEVDNWDHQLSPVANASADHTPSYCVFQLWTKKDYLHTQLHCHLGYSPSLLKPQMAKSGAAFPSHIY